MLAWSVAHNWVAIVPLAGLFMRMAIPIEALEAIDAQLDKGV